MMHWAICYSSRVSAVRPGARSPPTARQPAWRQRSAFSSLYLSWSGGSERWLAQRLIGGCWASCTCSPWSRSEDLNLQPDSSELVRLHFVPLGLAWKTSCLLWPFCRGFTNSSQSADWLQHHLHADVVGCCWGWNEAHVKTQDRKALQPEWNTKQVRLIRGWINTRKGEKSSHTASVWQITDKSLPDMIINHRPVFPRVSKLSFMVSKDVKVTLCICAFSPVCSQLLRLLCPHSVFELLPSTSPKNLFSFPHNEGTVNEKTSYLQKV